MTEKKIEIDTSDFIDASRYVNTYSPDHSSKERKWYVRHLEGNTRFLENKYYKEKDRANQYNSDNFPVPVRTEKILQFLNDQGNWENVQTQSVDHWVL